MVGMVPIGALLLYLLLGYWLARALFGSSGLWFTMCFVCIIGVPFIIEEAYKYQLVSEYSWLCDSIHTEPVHLENTDSTIVVIRNKNAKNPLLRSIASGTWLSPKSSIKEMLGKNFFALFAQSYDDEELSVLSHSEQDVSEICLSGEDQTSCGNRLLSKHSVLNIVITKASRLKRPTGHGISYWIWGNALGDENEVHHWTTISIFRGSFSGGGWPFWWPWTATTTVKTCSSNNMEFENWLVD